LNTQLLGPDPSRMDEIRPPMVVRDRTFVLFPYVERWSADEQNVFTLLRPGRSCSEETEENQNGEPLFHDQKGGEQYLCAERKWAQA